jgi:hypothetical protein
MMSKQHSNVSVSPLDAAYRATTYVVDLPACTLRLRIDERCPALDDLLQGYGYATWAFISACNPGSRLLSAAENATRHARLIETVNRLGLQWHEGKGVGDTPGWPAEASLLILGISHGEALALAKRFGQNAIVFGTPGEAARLEYLIGNSADNRYS